MRSVRSSAKASGVVNLNVVDDKTIDVESSVVGVALCVPEKLEQEFGGFLGPTTLSCAKLFSLGTSANTAIESTEWDALFVFNYILQVLLCPAERHVLDGSCRLMGILKKSFSVKVFID